MNGDSDWFELRCLKIKIIIRKTVHLRKRNTGVLALLLLCAFKRVPGFVLAAFYVAVVHVLCVAVALTPYMVFSLYIACGACP